MEKGGKYVYLYCVIPGVERKSFGKIGIEGNEVYTISYKDISAVLSSASFADYEPDEDNTSVHENIMEGVMLPRYTVLPASFGSVFLNVDRVKWMLKTLYEQLKTRLENLEDRVEVGVKAFWDPEEVRKEVDRVGGEIEKLKGEIAAKTPQELGEAIKRVLDTVEVWEWGKDEAIVRCYYAKKLHDTLEKCAEDTRLGSLVGRKMFLNGAFLVHRNKVEEFREVLEELEKEYASKKIEFQFSGPWAPYNFACIHVGPDGSVTIY